MSDVIKLQLFKQKSLQMQKAAGNVPPDASTLASTLFRFQYHLFLLHFTIVHQSVLIYQKRITWWNLWVGLVRLTNHPAATVLFSQKNQNFHIRLGHFSSSFLFSQYLG